MALDVAVEGMTGETIVDEDAGDRPTARLPFGQLLQISVYWLGINTIMGGIGVVVQDQVPAMVPGDLQGPALILQSILSMIVAAIVQPTVGMISDYTISRWGRRKPFIAIGATLDVLFLVGIGLSNTYLMLVVFLVAIQFSSNFAQGPFQGYIPDLVPQRQVGLASALVGLMQTLGFVLGTLIITVAVVNGQYLVPLVVLGLIELATAIGTIVWVREGRAARERRGRPWREIARSAWATDILAEKSFVNLVLSRLLFLAGTNMLLGTYLIFMDQTLGIPRGERGMWVNLTAGAMAVMTMLSTLPSARIADRIGRKPVIYAACGVGGAALVILGLAPTIQVFIVGAILMGVATGTFLAVDWALMTDIIPKAASGRYMGISNIAVASAGPLAMLISGSMLYLVGGKARLPEGPRAAYLLAMVVMVGAAFFLRRVDATPREGSGRAMTEL